MILELRPQAFEDGLSRFLDLQKQRSAVAAHEQADRTEGADASNADHLEGHVLERVALDEATPLGGEAVLVGRKNASLIDATPRVPFSREMINEPRPVFYPSLLVLRQVREVVVLFQMSDRLGHDGGKFLPQRAVIDPLDLPRQ